MGRGTASVVMMGALGLVGCGAGDGVSHLPVSSDTASASKSTSASPSPSLSVWPSASLPGASSPSASASPSGATATPTPVPVTGPDQKLVTMTITGGFAGVQRTVILHGAGTAYTSEKGQPVVRRLSEERFLKLRTLLGDPALDDVPSFSMHAGAADMFQYTLTYDGRTVVTDQPDRVPALGRLVSALSELLPKN